MTRGFNLDIPANFKYLFEDMNDSSIAVFDSGLGGLSVLSELLTLMPGESFSYMADSGNCPYGSRPAHDMLALVRQHMRFLMTQQCKLVVVACNTVTAVAIQHLRKEFHVPFVGMEPAVKPACRITKTRKIGILATQNTFNGRLYQETCQKYAAGIELVIQPGEGLVELVEKNDYRGKRAARLIEAYIRPMLDRQVDTIVLGCTHYPFFMPLIRQIAGHDIHIINPARAVALRAADILSRSDRQARPGSILTRSLYTSGDAGLAGEILGQTLNTPFRVMPLERLKPASLPSL